MRACYKTAQTPLESSPPVFFWVMFLLCSNLSVTVVSGVFIHHSVRGKKSVYQPRPSLVV